MKKCWKQLQQFSIDWLISRGYDNYESYGLEPKYTDLPRRLQHWLNNVVNILHKQLAQINIILKSILFSLPLPVLTLKKQPGLLAEALEHLRTQTPHKHSLLAKPNKFSWAKELASCSPLAVLGENRGGGDWLLLSPIRYPNFSLLWLKVLALGLANCSWRIGRLRVFETPLYPSTQALGIN